jgi:hypothetical protein
LQINDKKFFTAFTPGESGNLVNGNGTFIVKDATLTAEYNFCDDVESEILQDNNNKLCCNDKYKLQSQKIEGKQCTYEFIVNDWEQTFNKIRQCEENIKTKSKSLTSLMNNIEKQPMLRMLSQPVDKIGKKEIEELKKELEDSKQEKETELFNFVAAYCNELNGTQEKPTQKKDKPNAVKSTDPKNFLAPSSNNNSEPAPISPILKQLQGKLDTFKPTYQPKLNFIKEIKEMVKNDSLKDEKMLDFNVLGGDAEKVKEAYKKVIEEKNNLKELNKTANSQSKNCDIKDFLLEFSRENVKFKKIVFTRKN